MTMCNLTDERERVGRYIYYNLLLELCSFIYNNYMTFPHRRRSRRDRMLNTPFTSPHIVPALPYTHVTLCTEEIIPYEVEAH
ncbi:hypothetical protein GDO81_016341 [Engystomops pustulosus]|uniref:Uncharacterized protein n=1 Tax=Engystomops pustulosus TaxID=76066 RepID=A0AAV7AVZ3_ENGPU|nr:hypothetical protein GDO81_016341 [Engystomops pustulosus]